MLRVNGAFHLSKHKSISLSADNINLTGAPAAEISAQDFYSPGAQPGGCHQFSVGAAVANRRRCLRIPGAAPSVQQVQTSGDDVP